MKTNIPIFRAKTIKQDYNEWEECQQLKKIAGIWYAIGFYDCKREVKTYLGDWETTHLILIRKSTATSEVNTSEVIDISTLSIHFPDILDSQGNKIFASLQEDGKGGDLIDNFNFQEKYRIQTAIYKYNCFHLMDKDNDTYSLIECKLQKGIKVIGVKE